MPSLLRLRRATERHSVREDDMEPNTRAAATVILGPEAPKDGRGLTA